VRASGLRAAVLLLLIAVLQPVLYAQDAAKDPDAVYRALLARADGMFGEKQYDAAARVYAAAARMRADSARPLVGIARCVFMQARATGDLRGIEQAKVLLREARTRDAEWGGTWFFWGEISLAARDHANAVNGFRGALVKDHRAREARPLLAKSLLWLGADLARAGRVPHGKVIAVFAEARKMFEALGKDDGYPETERAEFERLRRKAMVNTAAVFQRANDLPAAEKIQRELIALDPLERDYRLSLGLLLAAAGKHDAAMVAYRKSVELNRDPDWVEACRPMGHLASLAGKVEDADGYLRKFVAKRPESPDGWRTLGDHLLRHGKPTEAAAAYGRCLELVPDHPAAMAGLVRALTRAGRQACAAKWSKLFAVIRKEAASR